MKRTHTWVIQRGKAIVPQEVFYNRGTGIASFMKWESMLTKGGKIKPQMKSKKKSGNSS